MTNLINLFDYEMILIILKMNNQINHISVQIPKYFSIILRF